MTKDQLTDLAQRLRDHAATLAPNATREDMLEAARYLRQCAQAEPVATVRVHNTGGNAGIAWSGVPTEHAGTMRGGTPLYTHPQPKQAGVPEGWKLVPVEPTVEMRRAGTAANDGIVSDIYRAMLAAAPQPPSAHAGAVEALRWEKPGPVSPNHPLECLIVLSALRQSDGDWWIEGNKFLADGLPIAWAPDTPEARAVLAAQGGDL